MLLRTNEPQTERVVPSMLHSESATRMTLTQAAANGRLYAVLDACDAPQIPPKMIELGDDQAVSLYLGMAEEEYWGFAPYLARMDVPMLEWIETRLAGEPWGVFIEAQEDLNAVRKHLHHFLIVNDPQDEEMYFRFYDPRVLRKYLPTCTPRELRQFFGTLDAFLVPDSENPNAVLRMRRRADAVSLPPTVTPIGQRVRIREEQMRAFSEEAERAFEARLLEHLREHHAEETEGLPDDLLLEMARTGISRARNYGMTWESNLTAYVGLMFAIAPNFDRHPRIQFLLNSTHIEPEKKLEAVIRQTPETAWRQARQQYHAGAWFAAARGY